MKHTSDPNDKRSPVPPITIAGRLITDPLAVVVEYLTNHYGTVANYDLFHGSRSTVTLALVRATRSPWMGSRISAVQADWFIDRAPAAPWDLVPENAELVDADPLVDGGLYDRAEALYNHFLDAAPAGVRYAKVSKVLHLMRPRLFPILDTRLAAFYRSAATDAAGRLGGRRPELGRHRRLYWAAVRQDVVDNATALATLRKALPTSDAPRAADVASSVGDVRLLDMMMWAAPR